VEGLLTILRPIELLPFFQQRPQGGGGGRKIRYVFVKIPRRSEEAANIRDAPRHRQLLHSRDFVWVRFDAAFIDHGTEHPTFGCGPYALSEFDLEP
jgi:hypothetical protein